MSPTTKIPVDYPGQFTSALVHEVRNPLNNINLSVEMLGFAIKDDDLTMYLDVIKRSSVRISNLINELLTYQQTDNPQKRKHSIHHLLDEVVEMAGDQLMLKNISVKKAYSSHDCSGIFNRLGMKIALTNIINNAIDAMTPCYGELKLVTKSIDGKYIIQIEDNGCGISKANLKKIFTPYFTNKPGGLGLGLSTSYHILRSNQVGVLVSSVEGLGTRFVLMFDKTHQYNALHE